MVGVTSTGIYDRIDRDVAAGGQAEFATLTAVVVLAPLPVGSVYQWSWAAIAVLAALALLGWCWRVARQPEAMRFGLGRIVVPAGLHLLAVGWALVQASGMTPAAWHHPIWAETMRAIDAGGSGAISLAPNESVAAAIRLAAYGVVFWLAAQHCRSPRRARQLVAAVALAGAVYGVYGIAEELSGSPSVLWFDKRVYGGFVTGTFVNRNIFASYAGLTALGAVALCLRPVVDILATGANPRLALRDALARRPGQIAAFLLAGAASTTALIMSGSRGGVAASVAAVGVLLLGISSSPRLSHQRGVLTAGLVMVAVFLALAGLIGQSLSYRLVFDALWPEDRLAFYGQMLAAMADAPWLGFGAGAFQDVAYLYSEEQFTKTWNYAHNLYLQVTIELGLPAGIALLSAPALVALACARGISRRRQGLVYPALGLAATAQVALHGLVDHPLIVPAVAVTYAALLGAAYAQSWSVGSAASPPAPERAAAVRRAQGAL